MQYVVYHKETTRLLRNHPQVKTDKGSFDGIPAAKAALTREVKRGAVKREDFEICNIEIFRTLQKTEIKHNPMSGKPFEQSVNTPLCCDPSSETYWSM